jgi:hypothetical protein
MTQFTGPSNPFWRQTLTSDSPLSLTLAPQDRKKLLRVFWVIASALVAYEFFGANPPSLLSNVSAILITLAALMPFYLWFAGMVQGLPLYPVFTLPFIWTYAFPFISNHPKVLVYTPESHLHASFIVSGSLCLGTVIWFFLVKKSPAPPPSYRALDSRKSERFFLWVLGFGILYQIFFVGRWFTLDGGTFSLVRGIILGLTALAVFTLAYRIGTQELSLQRTNLFWLLLATLMFVSSMGLILIGAVTNFIIATLAFTIGRKKIPILPIVIFILCFSLLHYGKVTMRAQHWGKGFNVQPWQYPAMYSQWVGYGLENFVTQDKLAKGKKPESPLARSSVVHVFLNAQARSPDPIPYLFGETYKILPQLLIPRFLSAQKIASHEGTYLLNIHYGLQTRKDTVKATIAWGLMAEAYANFGPPGCAVFCAIVGAFYGWATRWSVGTSILSGRSLFTVLLMTFAFQSEWTAGVYVAALFQSGMALAGVVVVLMKPYHNPLLLDSHHHG